jgi:hypothetical protein
MVVSCTFSVGENDTTTTSKSSKSNRGKSIDQSIRAEIDSLNNVVVKSILNNSPNPIKLLLSESHSESDKQKLDETIKIMSSTLISENYIIFDEFHVVNSEIKMKTTLNSNSGVEKDTNDYKLVYTSGAKESYVSLLIQNIGSCERMITLLYGKYDGQWKIDVLHIGSITIYGGTAPKLYYIAKEKYKSGELIPAFN